VGCWGQNVRGLNSVSEAVDYILEKLNALPLPPHQTLTLANAILSSVFDTLLASHKPTLRVNLGFRINECIRLCLENRNRAYTCARMILEPIKQENTSL
jgi:hypothetical protein